MRMTFRLPGRADTFVASNVRRSWGYLVGEAVNPIIADHARNDCRGTAVM